MKKIEWVIAIFFIGMGFMCMALSAVSFQDSILLSIKSSLKLVVLCIGVLTVVVLLLLRWLRVRRRE